MRENSYEQQQHDDPHYYYYGCDCLWGLITSASASALALNATNGKILNCIDSVYLKLFKLSAGIFHSIFENSSHTSCTTIPNGEMGIFLLNKYICIYFSSYASEQFHLNLRLQSINNIITFYIRCQLHSRCFEDLRAQILDVYLYFYLWLCLGCRCVNFNSIIFSKSFTFFGMNEKKSEK